jgi:hypothetical protein
MVNSINTMGGSTRIAPGVLTGLWIPAVAMPLLIFIGVLQFRRVGTLSERGRESRQAHLAADVAGVIIDWDEGLRKLL